LVSHITHASAYFTPTIHDHEISLDSTTIPSAILATKAYFTDKITHHIMAIMPYKNDKSINDSSETDITTKKYRPDQMGSLNIIQGEQAEPLGG